jgi:hypothetical protein
MMWLFACLWDSLVRKIRWRTVDRWASNRVKHLLEPAVLAITVQMLPEERWPEVHVTTYGSKYQTTGYVYIKFPKSRSDQLPNEVIEMFKSMMPDSYRLRVYLGTNQIYPGSYHPKVEVSHD